MPNLMPYDELAPAIIATLGEHDRDSVEARDAMEALSVLNSIRDSVEMRAPLARDGEVNTIASSGWFISRHDSVADALAWLAGFDRKDYGGFAVVEADRTGEVDTFRVVDLPR